MQIRNDFNSYSGTEYRQSHPHHMTKCLHEEGTKKPEAQSQGAGGKPDTFNPNNREEKGRQISPDPYREEAAVRKTGMKKGLKFEKSGLGGGPPRSSRIFHIIPHCWGV